MKTAKLVLFTVSIFVLASGAAFATKQDELDQFQLKPWSLDDLPPFEAQADVNETEPLNNDCPGEPYVLNDVYHAELTPGDNDWICFVCDEGDEITAGTDADGGLPTVDTFIELWDQSCGVMLASNDDGGPGLFSLIDGFVAPYSGSYYLKIRGFSSSSTGNYVAMANCVAPTGPGFCPVGTYKASKVNVNADIPDNDPGNPLVTTAIKFNDQPGVVITDVVIDLNAEHTWVGDLIVTLRHTADGGEVTEVDLMQQPGVPQSGFGCSGDLVSDPENKYYFGTQATLAPLGENDCPAVIDPACFAIAPESVNDLTAYRGLAKGDGTWELVISDHAAGDLGHVYNWSVHLQCETPIAVEPSSWGAIKASYK